MKTIECEPAGKYLAKEMREHLELLFPKCKFSIRTGFTGTRFSYGVALMAAPFRVFVQEKQECYTQIHPKSDNGNILTSEARKLFIRVEEIIELRNWNNSDIQSDYTDINFYVDYSIGRSDKPFMFLS